MSRLLPPGNPFNIPCNIYFVKSIMFLPIRHYTIPEYTKIFQVIHRKIRYQQSVTEYFLDNKHLMTSGLNCQDAINFIAAIVPYEVDFIRNPKLSSRLFCFCFEYRDCLFCKNYYHKLDSLGLIGFLMKNWGLNPKVVNVKLLKYINQSQVNDLLKFTRQQLVILNRHNTAWLAIINKISSGGPDITKLILTFLRY